MLVPIYHLIWQHTPGDSTFSHHNSGIWDKGNLGNRTKMRFWDRLATGGGEGGGGSCFLLLHCATSSRPAQKQHDKHNTFKTPLVHVKPHSQHLRHELLLYKLTVTQPVKKSTALYGTRRFVTVFTTAPY